MPWYIVRERLLHAGAQGPEVAGIGLVCCLRHCYGPWPRSRRLYSPPPGAFYDRYQGRIRPRMGGRVGNFLGFSLRLSK